MQLYGVLAVLESFVNLIFISPVTKIEAPSNRVVRISSRSLKMGVQSMLPRGFILLLVNRFNHRFP